MLIATIPCKRVRMEHIRPQHASMRVRLCFMLTFASANIILQTVDSGLCAQNVLPDPRKSQKRVSDNELHLSDPQNNKMVDITAMQKRKTGPR